MNKLIPNYGQEMIAVLWILFICIAFLLSAIVYLFIIDSAAYFQMVLMGVIAVFFGIFIAKGIWSSRTGKLIMRDKLIAELNLKGSEKCLDIGCGRGLLTVGIAKKLTTGKVIGLDHWQATFEYKYGRQMAENNVQIEGVANFVEIVDGDALKLPFETEQFDIITSSLVIHHVKDGNKAFNEMWRVLKPYGIIAIADIASPKITKEILDAGFEIIIKKTLVRLFFFKVNLIIAKKI